MEWKTTDEIESAESGAGIPSSIFIAKVTESRLKKLRGKIRTVTGS